GAADRPVAARAYGRAGRLQGPEWVLPAGPAFPQERNGQLVHLRLVGGPERLDVSGRRHAGEARDVIGVDHLEVGQVMPGTARAVGPPGLLHGVQGVADRAVAQRVEVNLEPFAVERGDEGGKLAG